MAPVLVPWLRRHVRRSPRSCSISSPPRSTRRRGRPRQCKRCCLVRERRGHHPALAYALPRTQPRPWARAGASRGLLGGPATNNPKSILGLGTDLLLSANGRCDTIILRLVFAQCRKKNKIYAVLEVQQIYCKMCLIWFLLWSSLLGISTYYE